MWSRLFLARRMHHWRDGWTFVRRPDGSVRIANTDGVCLTIPPNEWASVVADVSRYGGTADEYRVATKLHTGF